MIQLRRVWWPLYLLTGVFLLIGIGAAVHAGAPSSLSNFYGGANKFCGTEAIPRDDETIPWIGCFILSANNSASGTFANYRVKVTVEASGKEVFTVEDTVIKQVRFPQPPILRTNVPYVRPAGSGY
jgi:hypothetical protein